MIEHELLASAVLALAERGNPPSHRRHMLTESQVEAFNERRVDLPAAGRQHVLDPLQRAEDDTVLHLHQTATPYGLDDLGIEEHGQGQATGAWELPRWPAGVRAVPTAHSAS